MALEGTRAMKRIPTRIDRYPAKMVSHLAETLVNRYGAKGETLVDPFCGSGAILVAAQNFGMCPIGIDINPYASLMSRTKLMGFDAAESQVLCNQLLELAKKQNGAYPIDWEGKDYWFTSGTLRKFELLRGASKQLRLARTRSGRAVLLALALSVRLCSKADQRSPKPFISKTARETRGGRHFDPYRQIPRLLCDLSSLYSDEARPRALRGHVLCRDVSRGSPLNLASPVQLVMTSPPYINAQDYYRNFKLELHVLEGILPFQIRKVRNRFIGTERGKLLCEVEEKDKYKHITLLPELRKIEKVTKRLADVIHRYLFDMETAFDTIRGCMAHKSVFVLVCGDNLVGGAHIPTWRILGDMLIEKGFVLEERYTDKIKNRMLPPTRMGHRGLIKQEWISIFRYR